MIIDRSSSLRRATNRIASERAARRRPRDSHRGWLQVEWLEARLTPSTVTWTGEAADGLWSTAGNWDSDAVPTNSDQVVINGAAVALSGSTTVAALTLTSGATLSLDQILTVSGQTRLEESGSGTPATLRGAGPGAELIAAGGAYFDDYYQELDQLSLVIPAGATAEASASDLALVHGASIDNAGTLDLEAAYVQDDGTATLINQASGTIDASPWPVETNYTNSLLEVGALSNAGTISVNAGCQLTLGDAGDTVSNTGSITGGPGSGLRFAATLDQDPSTGSLSTDGSVGLTAAGSPAPGRHLLGGVHEYRRPGRQHVLLHGGRAAAGGHEGGHDDGGPDRRQLRPDRADG